MMAVAGMKYSKSPVCLRKLQNCKGSGVNRRKFCDFMHTSDRELAYSLISSQTAQESVGNKVNLELTIRISAHKISHTHNLSIKSVCDSFKYYSLGEELRTDIFIRNTLSNIQIIFTKKSGHRRNTI